MAKRTTQRAQPRAPKLMPRTKRYLTGELIALIEDAACALRKLSDANGEISAAFCDRVIGKEEEIEETLMRLCGRMLDIEDRAELPKRGQMRARQPIKDTYAELRHTLAALIEQATVALWELTKNRVGGRAAIDGPLMAMNRLTFKLGRMSWSYYP
jgi:hypothetical protein